jgi:hypothetical protein
MTTSENNVGLEGTRTLTEWKPDGRVPSGFDVRQVVVGRDDAQLALEIVVLDAGPGASMSREGLGSFHTARLGKRVSPVVVLARRSGQAWLFGPNAQAAVVGPLPVAQVRRMLQSALDEPSGLAARQRLGGMYTAIEGTKPGAENDYLPGVANSGLFATHELRHGVRRRRDWPSACETSEPLLPLRREALIEALGYTAHSVAAHAVILLADGVTSRAVAVLLDENESFDGDSNRFSVSPVVYAVSIAQKHELRWVMILRGSQLRLYPARAEIGVGRKGLAETYFEIDLGLVTDESSGFLSLVFSAPALSEKGSTTEILASSGQYAVALGERLRSQVYEQIVPRLSLAIAHQLPDLGHPLDREGLDLAYRLTLRVFFRLLFQAYAEDRKLLPFGENPRYDRNALNTLARDLAEHPNEVADPNSESMWDDLAQVWRVIDKGDTTWSVPPYNGGLFGCDPELQPEGELLERISVTNDVMGPVLRAMLIDMADGVTGPIDFRSLSVREFGTIYEGLLESNLAVADTDLVLDANDTWVPAKSGETLDPARSAPIGTVYFHNTSGQRKGTGSYFTPSFVIDHLLERSLRPALVRHLLSVQAKLAAGDQSGAANLFFDFRVADLAMGSGHFLTAAIDHLEAGMAAFLADNPIPGVTNELRYLEEAARDAVGPDAPETEPSSLLRRQIARRCIYGLDINPIAVELARVSIWIHTFVRGLPMSSLDHNLVCANSLTGIGTVDEALDALVPERAKGMAGSTTIFDTPIQEALERARVVLVDVANAAEATRKEAQDAARASRRAHDEAVQARLLFDAAVLRRIGKGALVSAVDPEEIVRLAGKEASKEALSELRPAHMPVLFPEVFLRDHGGFDCILGNPPWEKLQVERHAFWALRFPGLRGLSARDMELQLKKLESLRPDLVAEFEREDAAVAAVRKVLLSGPFPGLGTSHPDLYKAFSWRFLQLCRDGGFVGVVLPRVSVGAAGTTAWRDEVLRSSAFLDVTTLVNRGGWVFEGVEPRLTIALIAIQKGEPSDRIVLNGPYSTRQALADGQSIALRVDAVKRIPERVFPLLRSQRESDVFEKIARPPGLSSTDESWWARSVQGDLNSTTGKTEFSLDPAEHDWLVYKGGSFSLWKPQTADIYGSIDSAHAIALLEAKRQPLRNRAGSVFRNLPPEWFNDPLRLPCRTARVAYRRIARATDTRTVVAALVPPGTVLVDTAPYLIFGGSATEADEAMTLGCLSSIPLDWWARRIVEAHVDGYLMNAMPLPRPIEAEARLGLRIAEIAGRLAATDERYADWANAVGVAAGSVDENSMAELVSELDATVARLYGLNRADVGVVFETFHEGWDYKPRLEKVFRYFDALEGKE